MKRRFAVGSGILVALASLASCNTFDDRAIEGVPGSPPGFSGGPVPEFPVAGFGSAAGGAVGFAGAGSFSAGSGGFLPAAGSGGGGWQLLDAGTPPHTPVSDDGGADDDDAGR